MFVTPKLLINRCIYMLTVGRVLTTNMSQINLGQLLSRSTLKSQARFMFITALEMDNLECTKINTYLKNSQLVYRRVSITSRSILC